MKSNSTSRKGKGGGRRSRASIELQAEAGTALMVHERQAAPMVLSGEGAELWREMVQIMPAEWLDVASAPLLEAYIVHLVRARRIQRELEAMEAFRDAAIDAMTDGDEFPRLDAEAWSKLTNMYRRETVAMANLAGKLRIAPSSRYSAQWAPVNGGKGLRKKPWEFDG